MDRRENPGRALCLAVSKDQALKTESKETHGQHHRRRLRNSRRLANCHLLEGHRQVALISRCQNRDCPGVLLHTKGRCTATKHLSSAGPRSQVQMHVLNVTKALLLFLKKQTDIPYSKCPCCRECMGYDFTCMDFTLPPRHANLKDAHVRKMTLC
jgi:hypothetical protein